MKLRSSLRAVALLLGLVLSLVTTAISLPAPAGATTFSAAANQVSTETKTDSYAVEITGLSHDIISQGEDLTLTGTVHNNTDQPISGSLSVHVQSTTSINTSNLTTWLAGSGDLPAWTVLTKSLDTEIPPGQSTSFSLQVPAASLPFTHTNQWGPRGVSVLFSNGSTLLAQDRSLVIWSENAKVDPTRVTAVVPVTASAAELTQLSAVEPDLSEIANIRNRVLGLLNLAGQGVVLAVDPALIDTLFSLAPSGAKADSANSTSENSTAVPSPQPTATSAAEDPTAADPQLAAVLSRAVATDNVVALPWQDADIATLTQLNQKNLLQNAFHLSASSTLLAGAHTDVFWGAGDTLDAQTVSALPDDISLILAPAGTMHVQEDLTYTPSGIAQSGADTFLIANQALSNAFAGRASASVQDANSTVELSDLNSIQLLRATTAIITRQLPNRGRSVVVMLDRETATQLPVSVISQRLAALNNSWTTENSLASLAGENPESISRADLASSTQIEGGVSAAELSQAAETVSILQGLGSVLSDPTTILGNYSHLPLVSASSAWRSEPQKRKDFISEVASRKTKVVDNLTTAPSSTINLVNSQVNVPVTVQNNLDQDVTVSVHLEPKNSRLRAKQNVTTKVSAKGESSVTLPVSAIGSGSVELTVELLASDGTEVGTPSTMYMHVHADWENIGTAVVGILLALLLVIGIFRTVRRGRRRVGIEEI